MSADMNEFKLFTIKEVSTILSVTERTILNHVRAGKLPAQKICGRWRVSEKNLSDFINK